MVKDQKVPNSISVVIGLQCRELLITANPIKGLLYKQSNLKLEKKKQSEKIAVDIKLKQ